MMGGREATSQTPDEAVFNALGNIVSVFCLKTLFFIFTLAFVLCCSEEYPDLPIWVWQPKHPVSLPNIQAPTFKYTNTQIQIHEHKYNTEAPTIGRQ